ncbi:MAG: hypothetical protein NXI01_08205 [Gammaproteobacteria bacterium]|nr:hypothetical protein [Gammaproteobacteria bacterium]
MNTYWKTLAGRCIYRSSELEVMQNPVYRWLMFQNHRHLQTVLRRHQPHKPALTYLQPFTAALKAQPGPACLLGLGGGAIVHMAGPYLQTAVEVNPEVIAVAKRYFITPPPHHLNLIPQDAHTFVTQCTEQYQHLLIDIYTATGFPQSCTHSDFFSHCKRLLSPNGILALNLVNITQEFAVFNQLRAIFEQATLCIPVPSSANMIVLASPSKAHLMAMIQNHPTLKRLIWDGIFGYMAKTT